MTPGLLILGATGQIGRAFRAGAAEVFPRALWQSRTPRNDYVLWDILNEPAADLRCTGILSLAGSNTDSAEVHCALATAAADLGMALDVPVVIASSQAVYGAQGHPHRETDACRPINDYGRAKALMEEAVAHCRDVTCLRIGNVPGADMLFRNAQAGPVALDQWPDQQGPVRSMIGLQVLAQVCAGLFALPTRPPVLNIAQPGTVTMQSLLEAGKVDWHWKDAPETAVKEMTLDVSLLTSLMDVPHADPADMVAQGRACGVIT